MCRARTHGMTFVNVNLKLRTFVNLKLHTFGEAAPRLQHDFPRLFPTRGEVASVAEVKGLLQHLRVPSEQATQRKLSGYS